MRGQAVGALALVAAVGFGAAGCGEDSPKPGPVAESSNTPSPAEAASQAASSWVKALNSSSTALDPSELQKMSSGDCTPCQIIIDYISDIGANGGYIRGGEWENARFVVKSSNATKVVIDARVTVTPQRVKESAGARLKKFAGGESVPKRLTLQPSSAGWLVSDLQQEDSL